MKRKICTNVAGIMLIALLTACGHEHTWVDATCTEPRKCSECDVTEGNPLGHTWVDASCSEAKHCSVCGETEGEPLGHTLTEANYQQPATCEICGETVGDVLVPAFEEHNVKGQFMEVGQTYDYVTCCGEENHRDCKTVGKATITDYQVFTSDDDHAEKEGYEWKILTFRITFSDENAYKYGMVVSPFLTDYYDIEGVDNSSIWNNADNSLTFTVNYNDDNYAECKLLGTSVNHGWIDSSNTWTYTYECQLPVGYNGSIIGFKDGSISSQDGQYFYDVANDDTLFFRLN